MTGGILLIDKPAGITSYDVIRKLKKITGIKKIGHAGTLDPFATGLLIVGIGKATKLLNTYLKLDKEYLATAKLGYFSETGDTEGEIKAFKPGLKPSRRQILAVLSDFQGEIEQIPPKYSALKIKGVPAYKLARKGDVVKFEPRTALIHELNLISYKYPFLKFNTIVSSGTYIRTLAEDIGKKLATGAYLTSLRRTKIGNIVLKKAVKLSKINENNWHKRLIE